MEGPGAPYSSELRLLWLCLLLGCFKRSLSCVLVLHFGSRLLAATATSLDYFPTALRSPHAPTMAASAFDRAVKLVG